MSLPGFPALVNLEPISIKLILSDGEHYLMVTVVPLGQQSLIHFQNNPIKQGSIQTFGHGITCRYRL
jgi:hypothetical protein